MLPVDPVSELCSLSNAQSDCRKCDLDLQRDAHAALRGWWFVELTAPDQTMGGHS